MGYIFGTFLGSGRFHLNSGRRQGLPNQRGVSQRPLGDAPGDNDLGQALTNTYKVSNFGSSSEGECNVIGRVKQHLRDRGYLPSDRFFS